MRTYFGQKAHKNAHIKNFQKAHKCAHILAKRRTKMRTYFGQKAHKNAHIKIFPKKRTNAHMFWPKGAQKCAHQKFWLKVQILFHVIKTFFFKVHAIYQDILIANTWLKTYIFKFNKS